MGLVHRLTSRFLGGHSLQGTKTGEGLFLPVGEQVRQWRRANRKMSWGINEMEFESLRDPPVLGETERARGLNGVVLCYGFGDDGAGNSDPILSAKLAWNYALKLRKRKVWQCEYADFDRPENIRLRPEAPSRPRGFYYAAINSGESFKNLSVSQFRRDLKNDTGCGPECFQLLCITNPQVAALMNERKLSFMALADYDIAPHGFNDFYDAPQLFCSNGILGLGVGSIYGPYPLFGIPLIRIIPH